MAVTKFGNCYIFIKINVKHIYIKSTNRSLKIKMIIHEVTQKCVTLALDIDNKINID